MNKDLQYTTVSHQPSDYECTDGEMSTALGAVAEDGSLKPVFPPKELLRLSPGEAVKCVHETSYMKHYIVLSEEGVLSWIGADSIGDDLAGEQTEMCTFTCEVYRVVSIGNTVVVLTEEGMRYFLWKGEDDGYIDIGTEIPDITLSFGLRFEMVYGDKFEVIPPDRIYLDGMYEEFTDDNKDAITLAVLAKVNKFIADEATNKGRFMFPFFVRYAYRLYDQTLTRHSAPILMLASTEMSPGMNEGFVVSSDGDHIIRVEFQIVAPVSRLCITSVFPSELDDWKDIVSSIDIFISAPIYTYDESGQCTAFFENQAGTSYTVGADCTDGTSIYYFRHDNLPFTDFLPRKSDDKIKDEISNCSNFYFLKSYKPDEIDTGEIEIADDYLEALVTREAMTDDYDSHDLLIPKYAISYNSRLNIANLSKRLFSGYKAWTQFEFTDFYLPSDDYDGTRQVLARVYYFIRQDGREIVVSGGRGTFAYKTPFVYLYYPNTNAYKAVLEIASTDLETAEYYEVPLAQHAFLNGSYYFGGWEGITEAVDPADEAPVLSTDEERTVDVENKIYASEVSNPYSFPLSGVSTVGTGKIIAISTAAKALSQGQFGQFPLYVFSSEGVWALEVASDGTYSAKQPITRDVCLSEDGIQQLDSSVLFATARGIMLISGSETRCITDGLNARNVFSLACLPRAEGLVKAYNARCRDDERLSDSSDVAHADFLDFAASCRMAYDYVHQHIIAYVPGTRYAYVYSMKSKAWGMMQSRATETVLSYPDALAMALDEDGETPVLVDYCSPSGAETVTALIITRPITLGAPSAFKTVEAVLQRGMAERKSVAQALFASNDLRNWIYVGSSADGILRYLHGTPYKAYRLVLVATMGEGDSLFGCSIEYKEKLGNQLR